jgi:signal transduction histidine kinase
MLVIVVEDAVILASNTWSSDMTSSEESSCPSPTATYLRVALGTLKRSPQEPLESDARRLVDRCAARLRGEEVHPPKLFVLWLTKAFRPFETTLQAIHDALASQGWGDVPLIGSSVAVCLFDGDGHEDGAVLTCLASSRIEAWVAVGQQAQSEPQNAVASLLRDLGIAKPSDVNPRTNRFLITYMTGYDEDGDPAGYRAAEIVRELQRQTVGQLHMVGGVSSAGLESGLGYQFVGNQAHSRSVVAALVQSDVDYGIGIASGLKGTNQCLRIEQVSENERCITKLGELSCEQLQQSLTEPRVFGLCTDRDERIILSPSWHPDGIHVQRNVQAGLVLEVMQPDKGRMTDSVRELEQWVIDHFRVTERRISSVLLIGCKHRYSYRKAIGFDLPRALVNIQNRYPCAAVAGCYLDGEIGIDWVGRTELSHWSLAELILADDVPAGSEISRGFDALAKYALPATQAGSVQEAIELSLDCVVDGLGYRGAMISLVLEDGGEQWIVAQSARGRLWIDQVLPRTRRKMASNDILAVVAKDRSPRFIRDTAQEPTCDQVASIAGNVRSFYAFPLLDERNQTLGILQIDLGDMRDVTDLPPEQNDVLRSIGTMAAGVINRAIQSAELSLARKLDRILTDCVACNSVGDAVSRFAREAALAVGAHTHIRLFPEENRNVLRLVAGHGEYYETAQKERHDVRIQDESSSSAAVVRTGRRLVVNDTTNDRFTQRLVKQGSEGVATVLKDVASYADFLIGGRVKSLGTLSFHSNKRWFFTQSTLRILEDVGASLSFLILHAAEKEKQQHTLAKLTFLRNIAPPDQPSDTATNVLLRQLVCNLANAAKAEYASCFLWDAVRERFVLSGQSGWYDARWIGAARYRKNEGMTGTLAIAESSTYIPDLRLYKEDHRLLAKNKYIDPMLGSDLPEGQTCEVLALPLIFKNSPLGIVTLHRRRSLSGSPADSGFATTDMQLLEEAANILAGTISGLQKHDLLEWQRKEFERYRAVLQVLLVSSKRSLPDQLSEFCKAVGQHYGFRRCAVYMGEALARLRRVACYERPGAAEEAGEMWDEIQEAYQTSQTICWRFSHPPVLSQNSAAKCIALARREQLVERVFVPLAIDGRTIGVAEFGWRGARPPRDSYLLPGHDQAGLEELASRLAQAIKTQQLQEERERAQVALDNIAHTLRDNFHRLANWIRDVEAGLNMLQRRSLSDEEKEILVAIREVVEKQMQVFGKARDGAPRVAHSKRGWYRIDKLLHEAISRHTDDAESQGIVICSSLEEIETYVDGGQILEAFENLVENAVRAMRSGDSLNVTLRRRPSAEWEAVFEDTGPGIPPEDLDRLQRGEPPAGTNQRSGIGLLLTRLYCQSHNGVFQIESIVGQGTTVAVRIPLAEPGTERTRTLAAREGGGTS